MMQFLWKVGLILISSLWVISNLGNSVLIDTQGQVAELPFRYLFPKEPIKLESECADLGRNCSAKIHLCTNESHLIQMRRECASTCQFCRQKKIPIAEFLPDIQTVNGTSTAKIAKTASSLSKTIIKGNCFDEYIYCGEFSFMCDQQEYKELMSRHCSLTCGRCDVQHRERETCEDYVECEGMSALCHHHIYKDILQKQCRKTCGICKSDSIGCKDRHKNCQGFKDDGFCENEIYTADERGYLCGATCGLCQAP